MNFLLQKSQMCRLTPVCSRAACVGNAADISVTEDFNSEHSDWLERAMADNWGDFYTPECSLRERSANSGPFGKFSLPPTFNGLHIFIGLPSLYVIRRLNKSIF